MVLLLISWLILYFLGSLLGYGLLRAGRFAGVSTISQTETVLAGLIGMVATAQLASIGFPADYRLAVVFVLLAVVVNWRFANQPLRAALDSLRGVARQPLFWLLAAVVLLFAVRFPRYFDAGLYHIPSIRWYEQYGAVPGLGNLHGRLAFNSSFFVLSSVFAFTNVLGQSLFPLTGFMMLLFGTYVIGQLRRPEVLPGVRALGVLLLILSLYYLRYVLSSPSPDIWATLLPLFMLLFWLNGVPDAHHPPFYLFMALGLLCLTVKLGTLPVLLFLPLLLIIHWRSLEPKHLLRVVAIGAVLVGPWLVRNVILSGYLLYPFSGLDLFAVDWKIPLSAVRFEEDYVTFWARFHINEDFYDPAKLTWSPARWLPIWWQIQGDPQTFNFFRLNQPLYVAVALSPFVFVLQGLRRGWQPGRLWLAYGVALVSFLFWFVKAPELRFGLAFIWLTALLPWVPLLGKLPAGVARRVSAGALVLALLFFSTKLLRQELPSMTHLSVMPDWYGYRNLLADGIRYRSQHTQSGLMIITPQGKVGPLWPTEQRCYEIGQPCSPYFFDDLELRGTTLAGGFRRRTDRELSSFNRVHTR